MFSIVILLFSLIALTFSTTSYEGYKVYRIKLDSREQWEALEILRNTLGNTLDFWSETNKIGQPISVMATPSVQNDFQKFLSNYSIEYDILIENVESTIQTEKMYHKLRPRIAEGRVSFDQYLRYDETISYLQQLGETYPDIVTVENIGRSYEGRDLVLIRIYGGQQQPPESVIFMEGGIHAREWISPAMALYIISSLVENPDNRNLIANVEWIIWPIMNPDGYEYTWNNDRMWRKTRSHGQTCDGVDGNRNFGYNWMVAGASDQECSQTYAGPSAFSELETQAFRDFLLPIQNIKLYLSIHSHGQYLIYPWSYTTDLPENWEELQSLGEAVNSAISAVAGTEYSVGNSVDLLYYAAGCSDDWVMGGKNVSLVFVLELPGGGWYGFDLPASRISSVVQETWEGIKVSYNYVVTDVNKK